MDAYRMIGVGAFVAARTSLAAFAVFGLTLNTTPSYPRGLWRQVAVAERPVSRMALACPPTAPAFEEAVRRGYMGGPGSCPNGYRPVMKRIMAVAGDVVTFDGTGLAGLGTLPTDARSQTAIHQLIHMGADPVRDEADEAVRLRHKLRNGLRIGLAQRFELAPNGPKGPAHPSRLPARVLQVGANLSQKGGDPEQVVALRRP